jgi:hypothetical protein
MTTVTVTPLPDGRIQLSGGTFGIKDQIRAHGGRWNPAERVWTLPAGTDTAFVSVETAAEIYARVSAAVAMYRPARRDGRCCSSATAFWPSTDHYGPAHYRCPHHGETRSSYTGT